MKQRLMIKICSNKQNYLPVLHSMYKSAIKKQIQKDCFIIHIIFPRNKYLNIPMRNYKSCIKSCIIFGRDISNISYFFSTSLFSQTKYPITC